MSDPAPRRAGRTAVCVIAAVAANGIIGANGALPWRLPEDLRHFKRLTQGHAVIMGRKTWESIGRPLPDRMNFVVTRTAGYAAPGATVVGSLRDAIEQSAGQSAVFVIGGAALYREALAFADTLYLTEIQRDFPGDTRFPELEPTHWRQAERVPQQTTDGMRFDFVRYERVRG
jgi:dihydrofolate reductase